MVALRRPMNDSHAEADRTGTRVESNRALNLSVGFLVSSHQGKKDSAPGTPRDITGVQCKRPLKSSVGIHKIEVIPHGGKCERSVPFRKTRVPFERFQGQRFGFAETVIWCNQAADTKYRRGIGQTRVCSRIGRILADRLLKTPNRFPTTFSAAPIPVITTFQIGGVCVGINGSDVP